MATKQIIKTTFLLRRGTSEAWSRVNPTLADGEPGFEKDTNKLKIGDGSKAWNDLPYFGGSFNVAADGKTVEFINDRLSLVGYEAATIGQIVAKGVDGLEWKDAPQPIEPADLREIFDEMKGE